MIGWILGGLGVGLVLLLVGDDDEAPPDAPPPDPRRPPPPPAPAPVSGPAVPPTRYADVCDLVETIPAIPEPWPQRVELLVQMVGELVVLARTYADVVQTTGRPADAPVVEAADTRLAELEDLLFAASSAADQGDALAEAAGGELAAAACQSLQPTLRQLADRLDPITRTASQARAWTNPGQPGAVAWIDAAWDAPYQLLLARLQDYYPPGTFLHSALAEFRATPPGWAK